MGPGVHYFWHCSRIVTNRRNGPRVWSRSHACAGAGSAENLVAGSASTCCQSATADQVLSRAELAAPRGRTRSNRALPPRAGCYPVPRSKNCLERAAHARMGQDHTKMGTPQSLTRVIPFDSQHLQRQLIPVAAFFLHVEIDSIGTRGWVALSPRKWFIFLLGWRDGAI